MAVSLRDTIRMNIAASSDASNRLRQVCVQDHSTSEHVLRGTPHLHILMHFSDSTQSPWIVLDRVVLDDLKAELRTLGYTVRIHLHQPSVDEPVVANADIVQALPRQVLTEGEASLLESDGAGACTICLDAYAAGDTVACMPCTGLHKAHWACLQGWLERAATCPTCRFSLPASKLQPAECKALMKPAVEELARLRRTEPAPCQAAEPEPNVAFEDGADRSYVDDTAPPQTHSPSAPPSLVPQGMAWAVEARALRSLQSRIPSAAAAQAATTAPSSSTPAPLPARNSRPAVHRVKRSNRLRALVACLRLPGVAHAPMRL
uniref:RING-type domain-containing protein n=1 Tax=Haptolina ericina TaxID=156174 RepID=A0A7S3F300_9EUKA|mmetsp:Transcript_49523/g.111366  ORF Transcript_49523/g.111366 Transcript_49523/m.111366 type:complete len:319 (+) Transcript_49523:54-1010(+)